MQVICTDGSVLQCQRFEAIDSGVLLFGEAPARESAEDEEDAEGEDEEAMAFVPLHQLRFVLPDGVRPGVATGQPAGQATQQQSATQFPPTSAPTPPQGVQSQPMGTTQTASPQQQPGQPTSQQGPGRQR